MHVQHWLYLCVHCTLLGCVCSVQYCICEGSACCLLRVVRSRSSSWLAVLFHVKNCSFFSFVPCAGV